MTKAHIRQALTVLFLLWMGAVAYHFYHEANHIGFWSTVAMFAAALWANNVSKDPSAPWLTTKAAKAGKKR